MSSACSYKICPTRDARRFALCRGFVFIEALFGTELLSPQTVADKTERAVTGVTAGFARARWRAEERRSSPLRPYPNAALGRMLKTKAVAHIPDLAAEPTYLNRVPSIIEAVELGGVRTVLIVPMLKENELIGVFSLYRQEVRPFTDKQIALVHELRSPSRHRHRERAVAQRTSPAHH